MVSREARQTFLFRRPQFLSMMTSIPFLFFFFFSFFLAAAAHSDNILFQFFLVKSSRENLVKELWWNLLFNSDLICRPVSEYLSWFMNEYFSDYFNVFLSCCNIQKELRNLMKYFFTYSDLNKIKKLQTSAKSILFFKVFSNLFE
jgi:hypothetical protein